MTSSVCSWVLALEVSDCDFDHTPHFLGCTGADRAQSVLEVRFSERRCGSFAAAG